MAIENTQHAANGAAEEVIRDEPTVVDADRTKGLHHPNYVRAGWMDSTLPGTDKVTVGDAMLYTAGGVAVIAAAYGIFKLVKYFTGGDVPDAALIGSDTSLS